MLFRQAGYFALFSFVKNMTGRLIVRHAPAQAGGRAPRLRAEITQRRVAAVQRLVPATLIFNLVHVGLFALAVWGAVPSGHFVLWGCATALAVALLLVPWRAYRRGNPSRVEDMERIQRQITLLAGLRALAWGVGAIVFLPQLGPDRQLLVGLIAGGMMCAEVFGFAAFPLATLVYGGVLTLTGSMALLSAGMTAFEIVPLLVFFAYVLVIVRHQAGLFLEETRDAHARDEAQRDVAMSLNDFEANSSDWLWQTDASGRFCAVSPRFSKAAGLDAETLNGMHFSELFAPDAEFFNTVICERVRLREPLSDARASVQVGGVQRYWSISASPQWDRVDGFCGVRGVAQDITGKLLAERRLQQLAHTDQLTGLINRTRFLELLTEAFATRPASEIGIVSLDLTGFKLINDTLGHPVGDALLRDLGARLRAWAGDAFDVARLGGDEFTVLLLDINGPAEVESVAAELLELFDAPFVVGTHSLVIDGSAGAALGGAHGADADALMRNADLALYAAKAEGRGRKRMFEAEMCAGLLRRKQLECALHGAEERGELHLYYQPIFELSTGKVVAYEALLRWTSPELGPVDPEEFISVAEESGLIVPIGDWVLAQAARDAASWPSDIQVCVNVSPVQLRNTTLLSKLVQNLDRYGLLPSRLTLEITEGVLLEAGSHVAGTLHDLLNLGVGIALDDFGTGYSSLSYLRSFPFSKIKIDESFVEGLDSNPANAQIIRAIVDMANALGFDVVAEGVETPMQLAELKALNCKYVQGYLFAPPQSANDLIVLTDRRGKLKASQA